MKSILYGIFISAPLTAIIIYFSLSGRQDIVTQQKSHEIRQQIQSEEFRRDFAEAWHNFESELSDEQKKANDKSFQERQREREEKIVQLHKRNNLISQDMEIMFSQMEKDMDEMREALKRFEGEKK